MLKSSISIALTAGVIFGLSACGGGGSGGEQPTGYFIDSPVEGLGYFCDNKEGITNASGGFFCEKAPVIFKIGEMKIGELKAFTSDKKVYPQDILGLRRDNFSDLKLIKLVRLIQSLDDDGEIAKSIHIPNEISSKFGEDQIFDNTQLEVLAVPIKGELVDTDDAIKHLQDSMGSAAYIENNVEEESHEGTDGVDVDALVDENIKGSDDNNNTSDTAMDQYGDTQDIGEGYYVDAAIKGVEYECGNQKGITDQNGTFTFENGEDCLFKLGDMVLREVDAKDLTDKMTLLEDNLATAQLLQSLDNDNNADNGIEIGKDILDKIIDSNLTKIPIGDAEIQNLLNDFAEIEGFGGALVSLDMVKEHLRETEAELERLQSIIDENTIGEEDIDHSMSELESQLDSRLD
jgi:hypothetical protein